jgi:hypothetical protein
MARQRQVATFHRRMVPSSEAEASVCPSALNATLQTCPAWPSSTPSIFRVDTCHSRTVLSDEPDASACLSGNHATLWDDEDDAWANVINDLRPLLMRRTGNP